MYKTLTKLSLENVKMKSKYKAESLSSEVNNTEV